MRKTSFSLLFLLFLSYSVFASGFQINEHGSKAMAMGGAFAGLANDPSAIYFNPAGITQLMGTHLIGGTTLISPSSTFRGPAPSITEYELNSQLFTPIHLYGTHQLTDKFFVGLGVGNNYGLGTKWDDGWIGKYMAVDTEIRTFFFNVVASYQVTENLSLGLGYNLAYGDVIIGRNINLSPFNGEAYVEMEGDGLGSGFSAGLLFKASDALSVGLSYRSEVTIEFEGDAKLSNYPSLFEGQLPSGKIKAPLTTPANVTFGVSVKPMDKLTLTADYQYVGWSSYDKLEVTFNDFPDENGNPYVSSSVRDYDNSYIIRFGAEYNYSNCLDLWGGILYDKNPIKDEKLDPTLPDSDRLGLSLGAGYKLSEKLALQAGYLFLRFSEREITNSEESYSGIEGSTLPMNGVYNSVAHLISFTLSYNF